MSRPVRLALAQRRCSDDVADNTARTFDAMREAGEAGADIVVTQELFRTHYIGQAERAEWFGLAEAVHAEAPTVVELCALAAQTRTVVVASLFENVRDTVYFNTAVVIDADGRYLGKYRKMHIPDDPHYYEKFYFAPGDLGFGAFDTAVGRIGVLICWDQWFPESARLTALAGAELIVVPTAIGDLTAQDGMDVSDEPWTAVQRGHAIANAVFYAAVNRVGHEPGPDGGGIDFWGSSFVFDPYGAELATASRTEEETLVVEFDLDEVAEARRRAAYFFRDRRVDAYGDIGRRSTEGFGS